jgi:hypothetical protein
MEILKARRACSEVFQELNENNFNPRILYPETPTTKNYKESMKQKAGCLKNNLANVTKMRREKTPISKIRNAKGEITTNTMETQRISRDYFENLYSNKFEIFEEMDKFLDISDHIKLNQKDINHLKRSITQCEIEVLIVFQKRKVQDLMDSLLKSIRPLKKN